MQGQRSKFNVAGGNKNSTAAQIADSGEATAKNK